MNVIIESFPFQNFTLYIQLNYIINKVLTTLNVKSLKHHDSLQKMKVSSPSPNSLPSISYMSCVFKTPSKYSAILMVSTATSMVATPFASSPFAQNLLTRSLTVT